MLELQISPDKAIEDFCTDCRLRGMTGESIRRYKSSLVIFSNYMAQSSANIFHTDVQKLKTFLHHLRFERNAKHKTLENYFSALSAFYDYLTFEGIISINLILPFRKRYLRMYKDGDDDAERKILSVEQMSKLINSIMDPRDKAVAVLLAKTGVRRGELLRIDVGDINWTDYSIMLKRTPKRTNRIVFFDDECAFVLRRWLKVREKLEPRTKALFVSYQSQNRLDRNGVYTAIVKYATRLGFHDPESQRLEDHLSVHNFRHFFTTWLRRNGMEREFLAELRGDARKEALDVYIHLDREELRKKYLACVPKLGV